MDIVLWASGLELFLGDQLGREREHTGRISFNLLSGFLRICELALLWRRVAVDDFQKANLIVDL